MKKILITMVAALLILVGCGQKPAESTVLKLAGLESGYGTEGWKKVIEAFTEETGIEVEYQFEKNIADVLRPKLTAGTDVPDLVYLALNSEGTLTDTMVAEKGLADISDVLDMKVLGEEVKVKDKISPGFLNTLRTAPYADGKTFLAPLFFAPTGLFYNEAFLAEKGWDTPTTWDEMFKLGDLAKAEGVALITYATPGYLDGFMGALLTQSLGAEDFTKLMNYDVATWEKPEVAEVFTKLEKLASYISKDTVSQSNGEGYLKNQGAIIDGSALFMPNGTWVVDEMKDSGFPGADTMEWGLMPLPAIEAGGVRTSATFSEEIWVPKAAKNVDNAKKFISFLYSDKATALFFENGGAVQPVEGAIDLIPESDANHTFYSIFDNGATAAPVANFAARAPIAGTDLKVILFDTINEVVMGDVTGAEWHANVVEAVKKFQ